LIFTPLTWLDFCDAEVFWLADSRPGLLVSSLPFKVVVKWLRLIVFSRMVSAALARGRIPLICHAGRMSEQFRRPCLPIVAGQLPWDDRPLIIAGLFFGLCRVPLFPKRDSTASNSFGLVPRQPTDHDLRLERVDHAGAGFGRREGL